MKLTLEQAKSRMDENGNLNLYGTQITSLPEGLTVGGGLNLYGTQIKDKKVELKKVKKLRDGDYVEGQYLYADGILTHVKAKREVDGYTLYLGKIKGKNVVSDGKNYAHCNKLREGIADLLFKSSGCDTEPYRKLSLDTKMTVPELAAIYRKITGACRQGTENFINGLRDLKESYTIREAAELTRGQYNAQKFSQFFGL